jgi:leucyl-tRNA synthetase
MDEKYFPKKVEAKWQRKWAESGAFNAEMDDSRPKFYQLEMLPYPSGNLHMGHVRNYSAGDALAWYKRLQGFNVLHPIGWDSFGQPAEDAAVKRGINPRTWTEENIEAMRGQLQRLGISYDWRRQMYAHRPDYYKFDQWFFLKMYEKGLAYKKMTQVNWCSHDQATLSNEQASGGLCWRCGNPVTKKNLEQWFLKTTAYTAELLDDMDEIAAGWPQNVLKRQQDWIGRSEGAFIDFKVQSCGEALFYCPTDDDAAQVDTIRVFTTRVDTIYGANAIVVAAEHPVIQKNIGLFSPEVAEKIAFIRVENARPADHQAEVEKDGIDTGLFALNPFSEEQIPVWVGNYVLMDYGTGAVMSVPGHDERDFDFAQKFGLPVPVVIQPADGAASVGECFTDYGVMVNSCEWSGKTSEQAKAEMAAYAREHGFGEPTTTFRLRDWGISRQRFWGSPIPILYCHTCGVVPERYENLPVQLPENAPITGTGESPLAKVSDFVNATCPDCFGPATRETDTMDTFVDSSWYYFRYTDPHNTELPFDASKAAFWTPVDQYIGGDDHAVMHLIYARFWTKVARDLGLITFNEPFKRLLTQGMVVGETFFDDSTGKRQYHSPDAVTVNRDTKGKITSAESVDGKPLKYAIERMSKSKGNGVDPDEMVEIYGADAARLFVLFAAPIENELVWNEAGIEGAVRFLQRVWRLVYKWKDPISRHGSAVEVQTEESTLRSLRRKTHQTIKRVADSFETLQLNTPVAALMELSNEISDIAVEPDRASEAEIFAVKEGLTTLALLLTPFAPHAAEELYSVLTGTDAGIVASGARFPEYSEELAKEDEIEIAVQVNGKLRGRVMAAPESGDDALREMALADSKVREYTDGKEVVKIVVVPKRLVNIVVKG